MRLLFSINATGLLTIIYILGVLVQAEHFRTNRLNLVWIKAQNSLGQGKLADLKHDLLKHELDELKLKKLKAQNKDKDGLIEATVRRQLLAILKKYAIDRHFDAVHPPIKDEHPTKQENLRKVKSVDPDHDAKMLKAVFRDKRLEKLWKKAEKSGFSEEELMVLHEQFQHQQDRLDHHHEAMDRLDHRHENKVRHELTEENSIEADVLKDSKKRINVQKYKAFPAQKKAGLDPITQQHLNENYKGINKSINELHEKILTGKMNPDDGPFGEGLVNDLWASAKEANFTVTELESLKEELEYYETRIKKLKHFAAQLDRDSLGAKQHTSNDEDNSKETRQLKKRVDDLTKSVKETHQSIQNKIDKRKDEL